MGNFEAVAFFVVLSKGHLSSLLVVEKLGERSHFIVDFDDFVGPSPSVVGQNDTSNELLSVVLRLFVLKLLKQVILPIDS